MVVHRRRLLDGGEDSVQGRLHANHLALHDLQALIRNKREQGPAKLD